MELKIEDIKYKVDKLEARRQFHLVRRIAPLLAGAALSRTKDGAKDFNTVIAAIVNSISKMSNEEADFILDTCLSVCSRDVNGQWAAVQAPNSTALMYPLEMDTQLQLAVAVIEDSLGGFFAIAQQISQQPT